MSIAAIFKICYNITVIKRHPNDRNKNGGDYYEKAFYYL